MYAYSIVELKLSSGYLLPNSAMGNSETNPSEPLKKEDAVGAAGLKNIVFKQPEAPSGVTQNKAVGVEGLKNIVYHTPAEPQLDTQATQTAETPTPSEAVRKRQQVEHFLHTGEKTDSIPPVEDMPPATVDSSTKDELSHLPPPPPPPPPPPEQTKPTELYQAPIDPNNPWGRDLRD